MISKPSSRSASARNGRGPITGTNLLNASKDETFHKFHTPSEQIGRDCDEFEIESEKAGPVYQFVARYAR